MTELDTLGLNLGNVQVSGKGSKLCQFSYPRGNPVVWKAPQQTVLFEPSAFGQEDAIRVNICFKPDDDTVRQLAALDNKVVELLVEASPIVFGKQLSEDEVRARYTPCLKRHDRYGLSWKAKMGLDKIQCWSADKQPRSNPAKWAGLKVQPVVQLKSLWIMSKEVGCLFEATHIMIDEAPADCPF